MKRVEAPVLVVGAGPAGMTCALLLSRLGIASRVVERRAGPQSAPAAHVVKASTRGRSPPPARILPMVARYFG
jgi:2,4-dichlorophenol 6-monooxygenase